MGLGDKKAIAPLSLFFFSIFFFFLPLCVRNSVVTEARGDAPVSKWVSGSQCQFSKVHTGSSVQIVICPLSNSSYTTSSARVPALGLSLC